ncbi:hypothetical protein BC826DRAFT_1175231 [Russula brevipes]|nr:hypothetical protein BC826DRAFT_1175231 [Russula brevipes]
MFAFKQLLSLSVLSLLTLASAMPGPRSQTCPGPTRVVQSGDTCQNIADAASLAVTTLQALNPGLDCTNLTNGQVLCLSGTPQPPANCQCISSHVVQVGDTCDSIANAASTAVSTLVANNPGLNCAGLIVGQRLVRDIYIIHETKGVVPRPTDSYTHGEQQSYNEITYKDLTRSEKKEPESQTLYSILELRAAVARKGNTCHCRRAHAFIAEFITFHGRQSDNADVTVVRGVIVHLGILAAILFLYLVLAQIKYVVGPGGVMVNEAALSSSLAWALTPVYLLPLSLVGQFGLCLLTRTVRHLKQTLEQTRTTRGLSDSVEVEPEYPNAKS